MNIQEKLQKKTVEIEMTIEEALELIGALEKATPALSIKKEYKCDAYKGTFYYECPVCGYTLSKGDIYCKKCGQRIDEKECEL